MFFFFFPFFLFVQMYLLAKSYLTLRTVRCILFFIYLLRRRIVGYESCQIEFLSPELRLCWYTLLFFCRCIYLRRVVYRNGQCGNLSIDKGEYFFFFFSLIIYSSAKDFTRTQKLRDGISSLRSMFLYNVVFFGYLIYSLYYSPFHL